MQGPETARTEALLQGLLYIPIDFEAARLAGELRETWARKGKTFLVPDMIIAALCISRAETRAFQRGGTSPPGQVPASPVAWGQA